MECEVISQSRFLELAPKHIPNDVAELLIRRASNFTTKPFTDLDRFNRLLSLDHDDGYKIYLGEHVSIYDTSNDEIESRAEILEYSDTGKLVGLGEIRLGISNQEIFFKDKPFVGMSHTDENLRCRGLGRRRLFTMNAASILVHGLKLHSSDLVSEQAIRLWEKLEKDGHAKSYHERPDLVRYRFVN